MAKRIAVIGGGFAGLAVGCYARMNGYDVDIFEQHSITGGLCTAWARKGYTFDGCIHWLVGSDPATPMGKMWQELGLLRGQQFINPEIFKIVEDSKGNRFTVYTDPQRLKAEMLRLAPEDAAEINHFIGAIEKARRPDSPANIIDSSSARSLQWLFTWVPFLLKYGRMSLQDFDKRWKNPFLAWAFTQGWDMPEFSFIAVIMTLAWLANKNAGYPIGGSLALAKALEQRAKELGCHIHTNARVSKVLVEDNAAVGVQLACGEQFRADYTIGAGDLHSLIYDLLDGRFGSARQKGYFGSVPLFESIMLVSYGVRMSFADFPSGTSNHSLELPQEMMLAGAPQKSMHYRVFNFDPTLAPPGATVVQVYLDAPYEHWAQLAKDEERYAQAKQEVADACARVLESRFPGFQASIDVVDVASPTTFERYTSNWLGSYEGWLITPKTITMNMPKTLQGLDRLYLTGQWVQPGGGLPTAAMTSRQIVKTLCKLDGIEFHTESTA